MILHPRLARDAGKLFSGCVDSPVNIGLTAKQMVCWITDIKVKFSSIYFG